VVGVIGSALIAGAAIAITSPILTSLVKSGERIDYSFDRNLGIKDIENFLRNDPRLNEKVKAGGPEAPD
jgi:hypothetical protein